MEEESSDSGGDDDEFEALYEKRNKKAALLKAQEEEIEVDPADALPIKTLDGKLQYRIVAKKTRSEEKNDDIECALAEKYEDIVRLTKAERREKLKEAKKLGKQENELDIRKGKLHAEVLEKVQEELSAEEIFAGKKMKLAEIGMALLEYPGSNIRSLKELLNICNNNDHNIVKLALMSLLAVFKDLIPGYRIRSPTEKELAMTVSKEVKKMRFYEHTLLSSYKVPTLPAMEFFLLFCIISTVLLKSLICSSNVTIELHVMDRKSLHSLFDFVKKLLD